MGCKNSKCGAIHPNPHSDTDTNHDSIGNIGNIDNSRNNSPSPSEKTVSEQQEKEDVDDPKSRLNTDFFDSKNVISESVMCYSSSELDDLDGIDEYSDESVDPSEVEKTFPDIFNKSFFIPPAKEY